MNNDNGSKPNNTNKDAQAGGGQSRRPAVPPQRETNADSTRVMPAVNTGSMDKQRPPVRRNAPGPSREAPRPAVQGQPSRTATPSRTGQQQDARYRAGSSPSVRRPSDTVPPSAGRQRGQTPVRKAGVPIPPGAGGGNKSLEELDQERRKRERREDKGYEHGASGIVSSVVKALVYIVLVFGVSIFIAYNAILIGNDVFAFVKPSKVIDVTIPEGAKLGDVSKILEEAGLIKYPSVFELYAKYREREDGYVPGTYPLSTAQNYDEMMIQMRQSAGDRDIKRLTFKEGITVDEIIDIFVQNGMGSKAKFVDVINNYDFNYDFVKELDKSLPEGRKYRLEGYLYPDTYEFFADAKEEAIIDKFLLNFDAKFNETFRTRCKTVGLSVDEAINLASIVQGEARHPEDFTLISSVFHNRLASSEFPRLESDATIQYTFSTHKTELTSEDLQIQSPYNTYLTDGLPPSAINNPGLEAINAALYPDTTEYYYFVSDKSGNTYYAKTLEEHNVNKNTAKEAQ